MASASGSGASWENWAPSWASGSAPASLLLDPDDEINYDNVSQDQAAMSLVELIVDLKVAGTISAKTACLIAFWAAKAGAAGEVSNLGAKPGLQSGHYSKKFDLWSGAGVRDLDLYDIPLARQVRFDASRRFLPLPMRLPSVALGHELESNASLITSLQDAVRTRDLPALYFQHPSVRTAPEATMHPFCMYMDAVPHTRNDSILGIFVYFALSALRHLVWCCRKSEMCSCGCRGLCTLLPVFEKV